MTLSMTKMLGVHGMSPSAAKNLMDATRNYVMHRNKNDENKVANLSAERLNMLALQFSRLSGRYHFPCGGPMTVDWPGKKEEVVRIVRDVMLQQIRNKRQEMERRKPLAKRPAPMNEFSDQSTAETDDEGLERRRKRLATCDRNFHAHRGRLQSQDDQSVSLRTTRSATQPGMPMMQSIETDDQGRFAQSADRGRGTRERTSQDRGHDSALHHGRSWRMSPEENPQIRAESAGRDTSESCVSLPPVTDLIWPSTSSQQQRHLQQTGKHQSSHRAQEDNGQPSSNRSCARSRRRRRHRHVGEKSSSNASPLAAVTGPGSAPMIPTARMTPSSSTPYLQRHQPEILVDQSTLLSGLPDFDLFLNDGPPLPTSSTDLRPGPNNAIAVRSLRCEPTPPPSSSVHDDSDEPECIIQDDNRLFLSESSFKSARSSYQPGGNPAMIDLTMPTLTEIQVGDQDFKLIDKDKATRVLQKVMDMITEDLRLAKRSSRQTQSSEEKKTYGSRAAHVERLLAKICACADVWDPADGDASVAQL